LRRLAEIRPEIRAVLTSLRPLLGPLVAALTIALLTAAAWASWSYRRMADAALDARFAFRFSEPPAGPRAPRSEAFGARVGQSSLKDVQQLLGRMQVECPDTSPRAMIARSRAARLRAQEERKRKGLPPDAVSAASSGNRRSLMERNPQIRISCEGLPTSRLSDRPRAPSEGRLLLVFDSAEHPLRHISYQRTVADPAVARVELDSAVTAYQHHYGPPHRQPKLDPTGLPWLAPVEYEWTFSDLTVRLSALNFGGQRGTMLTELIEVPLPIRPSAPGDPR
jgi:hypothetical protein